MRKHERLRTVLRAAHALCAAGLLALAAAMAFSLPARAQSNDAALDAALALCGALPNQTQLARDALRASGWEATEEGAPVALYNAMLAFNFDATDLSYTFGNASFMMASVLGNSSLGDDQVSMSFEEYNLGILGIAEGTPYCVLSGPETLILRLSPPDGSGPLGPLAPLMRQTSTVLVQVGGRTSNGHIFALGRFDIAALGDLMSTSNLSADDQEEFLAFISPVSIHIISWEVWQ